ncbi:hypothetical protein C7H19_04775 [Aphanothece hegewaldii CCALA 016]|uniref:Uncharacterized protein n=1 Tax=Aphanothece hegewaldii CCALA 016 TaxID=2107694 RepID=A0A2T1M0V8_9CHRO|nr:hypothetical protein [Aphanothece hegewaldii]PSF38312.1 hypothetical protein C7H19_04775 [Aphanothece hegewaldii CCALA 016]
MAGFFGLFGSKTKYVDEPTPDDDQSQNTESFYLSDDDAKSLGKSIKKKDTNKSVNSQTSSPQSPTVKKNPSVDSNMDMFRKMAKDIKKK